MKLIILYTFLALSALSYLGFKFFKNKKRKYFESLPKPSDREDLLNKNFNIYRYLPENIKDDLNKKINVFINEKHFCGCKGLKITDEIKTVIAAQACLLVAGKPDNYYDKLISIYVYPTAYVDNILRENEFGVVTKFDEVRLGESWGDGSKVVLSWASSRSGGLNHSDGKNVVYHEFAHQLDQEDGRSDGTPVLSRTSSYAGWAEVFNKSYKQLHDDLSKGRKTLIDEYGATNPAEFFAVVTELFFEKPEKLYNKNSDLYDELKDFYNLDPLEWLRKSD